MCDVCIKTENASYTRYLLITTVTLTLARNSRSKFKLQETEHELNTKERAKEVDQKFTLNLDLSSVFSNCNCHLRQRVTNIVQK